MVPTYHFKKKFFLLILERDQGRGKERNISCLLQDQARNPSMCPDQESNPWPGAWHSTNWAHCQGSNLPYSQQQKKKLHLSTKQLLTNSIEHFLTLIFRAPKYPQKLSLNYHLIYEVFPKYPRQSLNSFLDAFITSFILLL